VDGVGKKFCRSLKKSLWYGVCDIAGELLPGRKRQRVAGSELRVTSEEGRVAGSELLVASRNTSAESGDRAAGASEPATRHQLLATAPKVHATSYPLQLGEEGANQNIYINGSVLGLTKTD
jgi:hypothetical protein